MDVLFASTKLRKEMTDGALRVRRYGDRRASLIRRRLDELRAAEVLSDIRNLTGPRCHEYTAPRKGQLSVDLDHPYRLVLEPADDPIPRTEDGGLDWDRIRAITVLEVWDPHGK